MSEHSMSWETATGPKSLFEPIDPKAQEVADRLKMLVGKRLERIEVVPLGVMFHFEGGIVYWAYGGPLRK